MSVADDHADDSGRTASDYIRATDCYFANNNARNILNNALELGAMNGAIVARMTGDGNTYRTDVDTLPNFRVNRVRAFDLPTYKLYVSPFDANASGP